MWSTDNGYNVYNGIYELNELYQASITLRVYKQLYLKTYYEYMGNSYRINSKSLIPSDANSTSKPIDNIKFNTHSIIGGLIWEF